MDISNIINNVIIHDATQHCWLHFNHPRQIIIANQMEEVIPALNLIEEVVFKQGLYAAGFISYEASPAFDPPLVTKETNSFPLLWFGIYDHPEAFCFPKSSEDSPVPSLVWIPSVTEEEYRNAIGRIKTYIEKGDTYQVNFTYRLRSSFRDDPWRYFIELTKAQNALYGAFINTEKWSVCSASPELFFSLDGKDLNSRPMKGTAPRGLMSEDDMKQAEWLRHSKKNRAENVMIVDMIRNDMGRIAQTGTVTVSELFTVEKYPTLWQMTSTVRAKTEASLSEILKAIFPCASITGAPKARTMEIIAELETSPRQIYTGSIGFIRPDRKAQFNVAIRTVLIDKEKQEAEYGVGGGIVWDSTDKNEFEECHTKAKILTKRLPDFSLLETILWTPDDGYYLLKYHLARLKDSAAYFSFPVDMDAVSDKLFSLASDFSEPAYKVRLLVANNGNITCESVVLEDSLITHPPRLCLAKRAVDSSNPFLYHKTTNRQVYKDALAESPGYDDVILWNEKGEVTESCIANIVVGSDGELYTPPVRCGLLSGTLRASLLEQGKIKEKIIKKEDVARYSHIYLINSVRKQREVFVDL